MKLINIYVILCTWGRNGSARATGSRTQDSLLLFASWLGLCRFPSLSGVLICGAGLNSRVQEESAYGMQNFKKFPRDQAAAWSVENESVNLCAEFRHILLQLQHGQSQATFRSSRGSPPSPPTSPVNNWATMTLLVWSLCGSHLPVIILTFERATDWEFQRF